MPLKDVLDRWTQRKKPQLTSERYAVHLDVEDAARIHALADLHPGVEAYDVVSDLLAAALDEVEAAMPYVAGAKVIREDDHGDPVYEDVGMTPKFLELVRKHRESLQESGD